MVKDMLFQRERQSDAIERGVNHDLHVVDDEFVDGDGERDLRPLSNSQ
jgi:hypothetical protein